MLIYILQDKFIYESLYNVNAIQIVMLHLSLTELNENMLTSSNGNIFRVTGPFVRGIHRSTADSPVNPGTKASDAKL